MFFTLNRMKSTSSKVINNHYEKNSGVEDTEERTESVHKAKAEKTERLG